MIQEDLQKILYKKNVIIRGWHKNRSDYYPKIYLKQALTF